MKLDDIYPAVLTILIVGMVLGIGVYVLAEVGGNLYLSTAGTNTNESADFGASNTTSVTLAASLLRTGACGTITQVRNGTLGAIISSGNYSQTGCALTNSTSTFADTDWLVTYPYTYDADTEASKSVNTTAFAVGDFAD